MKILKLRYGHANNSSSSHSVVVLSPSMVLPPEDLDNDGDEGGTFGWGWFMLTSRTNKLRYCLAQLVSNTIPEYNENLDYDAYRDLQETAKRAIVRQFNRQFQTDFDPSENYCVDHQSKWDLPKSITDPDGVDMRFFTDLTNYIMNDRVVIEGGNDNEDDHISPLDHLDVLHPLDPMTDTGHTLVSRYDPVNKNWALFNRITGKMLVLDFNGGANEGN
jgi:hypothetical protein